MKETPELDIDKKVEIFLVAVVPDDASHTQIKETRKAFIAGMWQSYIMVMGITTFTNEKEADKAMNKFAKDLKKAVDKCQKDT